MKVALDTNVIVSALVCPQSLPAKIAGLVLNGKIGIVYDNNVLAEYIDVLNRESSHKVSHSGLNTFLTALKLPRSSGFLGIQPLSTNKLRTFLQR
jgi:predicted nucleic acid-binding protein